MKISSNNSPDENFGDEEEINIQNVRAINIKCLNESGGNIVLQNFRGFTKSALEIPDMIYGNVFGFN